MSHVCENSSLQLGLKGDNCCCPEKIKNQKVRINLTEQCTVKGLCPQVQVNNEKISIAGKIKRTKHLVCSDINKDNIAER